MLSCILYGGIMLRADAAESKFTENVKLIVPLFVEGQREMSVGCGDENFSSPKSSQGGSCLSLRSANAVSKRSAEKKRFAYNTLYYTCRHYLPLPSLRSVRITIELA